MSEVDRTNFRKVLATTMRVRRARAQQGTLKTGQPPPHLRGQEEPEEKED